MRRVWVWLVLMVIAGASAFAASGDEFYDRLYSRGVAQFNEGNYAGATSSLRIAAFGLVDDIARFETAQVYLALAAMRLHREKDARGSALRLVDAERVERRYASLALPEPLRKEFEDLARTLLTPEQLAQLHGGGATATPQPQPRRAPPPAPTPAPAPAPKTITIPPPVIVPAPQPQSQPPAQPKPTQPQPQSARNVETLLADADRAVTGGDLAAARSLYRGIVDAPQLTHANALRAAEGAYRSRDFATAVRAFQRAGSIGKGEEQYHYYYAVALYETGLYAEAKRELRAALPYIEVTPDVARYQTKIEGATE